MEKNLNGEVAELVLWLRLTADGEPRLSHVGYGRLARAADLLERLAVPERVGATDEDLDELFIEIDQSGACQSWRTYARAVLARWGTPNLAQVRSSLGDEPVPAPGEMQALATAAKERAPIPKPQPHGGRMIKGWQ